VHDVEEIARSITNPHAQAQVLRSIVALAEPAHRAQIIATLLTLTRWYETTYDLLITAPDAITGPITELVQNAARVIR
jgi:hypothetical protein